MSKLKDSGNVFKNVVLVTGYLKERRYAHLILACILGMITILTTHHLRHNTCRCYIFLLCKLEKEFFTWWMLSNRWERTKVNGVFTNLCAKANWFPPGRPFKRWPDVIFNSFRLRFSHFLVVFLRINAPSGEKGCFLSWSGNRCNNQMLYAKLYRRTGYKMKKFNIFNILLFKFRFQRFYCIFFFLFFRCLLRLWAVTGTVGTVQL